MLPGNFVAFLHNVDFFFNWRVPSEDSLGEIQKKRCNEAEDFANRNMGARKQYSSISFHGGLIERISLILPVIFITNVHDFYTSAELVENS